jgi:hypothetical protein
MPTKNYFLNKFFCLLLFERKFTKFTSFFKDKNSKRNNKAVGIKVFPTIFIWWYKDPDPDPYLWLWIRIQEAEKHTDPDPEPQHWLQNQVLFVDILNGTLKRFHCKDTLKKLEVSTNGFLTVRNSKNISIFHTLFYIKMFLFFSVWHPVRA